MYEKLEGFVQKIPEFLKKTSGEMIIYLAQSQNLWDLGFLT